MKRVTFFAAAAIVCASTASAQTPAPTPPPPATQQPSQPTPKSKPRIAAPPPAQWQPLDAMRDHDLDLLDMQLDLDLPHRFELAPMPPDAPMALLSDMADMPDMVFLPDMAEMPELAELPDMAYLPDMLEMPELADVPWPSFDLGPDLIEPMMIEPMTIEPPMIEPLMAPRAIEDFDGDVIQVPATPATPAAPAAPVIASSDLALSTIQRFPGASPFEREFGGIANRPPQPWAQSDPADSLYRLARETLNRGEYRRAAQLFGDITQRFPNSAYAADARYWRAFALYRIGGTNDLRDALRALQDDGKRYYQASLQVDAAALTARIQGALAAQGDAQAAVLVNRKAVTPGEACDREDLAVRVEALNSLGRTDPESTTPILRRLLARRDECSASLRRAALYLLGRRSDADAMNLVMAAAKTDPDLRVRAEALRFLAAMPGDQPIATIEEIARAPGNDQLQRAAVAALGRSDSPRARQSLRAIIERTDLNENLRATALASVNSERSAENGSYLRSIYPKLETPRLKAAAIRGIARAGGQDNEQWLLSVVRNPNEQVDVRAMALRYAGVSTIPIADLVRMYDVTGDRPLREQLINLYAQRSSAEASDKLVEIAKKGTDPEMRRRAISALSRKNDPRTKQLLLEIIDK
jgi:HEAT repeat protein